MQRGWGFARWNIKFCAQILLWLLFEQFFVQIARILPENLLFSLCPQETKHLGMSRLLMAAKCSSHEHAEPLCNVATFWEAVRADLRVGRQKPGHREI